MFFLIMDQEMETGRETSIEDVVIRDVKFTVFAPRPKVLRRNGM